MEIERKWLVSSFPTGLKLVREADICQGYLSTGDIETRIRSYEKDGHKDYMLTFKGHGDIERPEVEDYIKEEFFNQLRTLIGKPLIHKTYKKYQLDDGKLLEVSWVDSGTKNEFMYAEIEFDTREEAEAYELDLDVIISEVTYNPCYKMKEYWKQTRN
jgi:CYTH domain-containing protein